MQRTPEEIELIKCQKRLTKRFHKACADYGLIEDGDHILIGLSGGKDSLALVELLGRRQKIHVPRFRVTAVHVSVTNVGYQSDHDYLQEFCANCGVDFKVVETEIRKTENAETQIFGNSETQKVRHLEGQTFGTSGGQKEKNMCFLCSWYRRKALFEAAKELGCNKIALGHHKDDIVETLLMNLIFQGTFGTIAPKLQMEKFPMLMIRPLCLIHEEDLQHYATLAGYKKQQKLCPFEKESSRAEVKNLLSTLKQFNPNALDSIWGAMENIKTEYLPHKI